MKFCAISGITPDKLSFGLDEKHPDCIQLKLTLLSKISDLSFQGITDFVCNCEFGTPLWAAEIVLCSRNYNPVRLNIIIPHEEQAAYWSDEWRERYYNIHAQADSVIMLETEFTDTCYQDCDRFMVDNSDMLLWVGDGNSDIINYAKENKKQVIAITC